MSETAEDLPGGLARLPSAPAPTTLWFLLKWDRYCSTPEVVETSWDEDRLRFSAQAMIAEKPEWVTYSLVSKDLPAPPAKG